MTEEPPREVTLRHERWLQAGQALLSWLVSAAPFGLILWLIQSISDGSRQYPTPWDIRLLRFSQDFLVVLLVTSPVFFLTLWWLRRRQRKEGPKQMAPGQLRQAWRDQRGRLPRALGYAMIPVGIVLACVAALYELSRYPNTSSYQLLALGVAGVTILASVIVGGLWLVSAGGNMVVAAAHDREVRRRVEELDIDKVQGGLAVAQESSGGDLSVAVGHGALEVHEEVVLDLEGREQAVSEVAVVSLRGGTS